MADLKEALSKKTEVKKVVYTGQFRVLNKYAIAIEWDGQTYSPKNEEEVADLEYQVKMGRVTKS